MRIFLTGATGFIGSALVPELIARRPSGGRPDPLGRRRRARSPPPAPRCIAATLEELDSLRGGAAKADGVIHTAFDHDFSRFVANCEKDRRVIAALGAALAGSDRPLVITSGTGMGSRRPGQLATRGRLQRQPSQPAHRLGTRRRRVAGGGRQRVGGAPAAGPRPGQAGPDHATGRRSRARRASRPMWAKAATAGRRRMSPTSPASTGWRWRGREAGRALQCGRRRGRPVRAIAEAIGRG